MSNLLSLFIMGISVLLLTSSPQIDASIYKWKDAQGQVHYSQSIPDGIDKDKIKTVAAPAPSKGETSEKTIDSEAEKTNDEDVSVVNGENSAYCEQQNKIIKALQENDYVKWKIDDKEVLLEGDAKAAQVEKIKKDMSQFCSGKKEVETTQ